MTQHLLITGNPVDGFAYTGPFDDFDEAAAVGHDSDDTWWVAELTAASADAPIEPAGDKDFDQLADAQGWNAEARLAVALAFIAQQGTETAFDAFGARQAALENEGDRDAGYTG